MLYGREAETAETAALLARARAGGSGVLVVHGEAGIGKTALLAHTERAAAGMRVLRGVGVEHEAGLPFAGLHLLLHGELDRAGELPAVQAAALRRVLGHGGPPVGDRFLVGLAVLSLLSALAEERPLLCLVDDAHWFDQESADALLFAARRLESEGVAMVFAVRDEPDRFPAPDLPHLAPRRLDRAAAAGLLAEREGGLAPLVRDRLIEEAHGNPLALIELATALTPQERRGETAPAASRLGAPAGFSRVPQGFRKQIAGLPDRCRTMLLLAAAEESGDLELVLRAGRRLGASVDDLVPAERAGLARLSRTAVAFRHPLARAAAYHGASLAGRIAAHRAMAEVLTGEENADRRAWHLAATAIGPDEEIAGLLAAAAENARLHGGIAAAAAAYEKAARLTPDTRTGAHRLAAAAQAAADAGRTRHAARLAERAAPYVTDPEAVVRVARVRAGRAYEDGRTAAAHRMLLAAATEVAADLPDAASFLLFDVLWSCRYAGDPEAAADVAARLSALPPAAADGVLPMAEVAAGMAHLAAGRPRDGVRLLRRLVDGVPSPAALELHERLWLAHLYFELGDLEAGLDVATSVERECRSRGAIGLLPQATAPTTAFQLLLGRHRDALAGGLDGLEIARDVSQGRHACHLAFLLAYLAAVEGDEPRCREMADRLTGEGAPHSAFRALTLGLLDLGLGRYDAALYRLRQTAEGPGRHTMMALFALPDRLEAAVRAGEPDAGAELFGEYAEWADCTGQPWARAIAARCRALLAAGDDAEEHYAAAVELHRQGNRPFERARTELLYGEWLRRRRRRDEARAQLRSAAALFERLDAVPWAERAREELRATGETPLHDGPGPDLLGRLSPRELQIVRLAAAGLSNRDIGARLFLSPRTVGYHLYKAYPKLGIASRAALSRLDLDDTV